MSGDLPIGSSDVSFNKHYANSPGNLLLHQH